MNPITNSLQDLIRLFFPHNCAACEQPLANNDELLCIDCISQLPFTNIYDLRHNPVAELFHGRASLASATACFYFSKSSLLQSLIHQVKYKGRSDLGLLLGTFLAEHLQAGQFNYDCVVPVPLYRIKEKKRGYNQSALLAEAIASRLAIPSYPHALKRLIPTETQTHKGRVERWENVKAAFAVEDAALLTNKHVLLIDDVLTTGATLDACTNVLQSVPGITVSIAALAWAHE